MHTFNAWLKWCAKSTLRLLADLSLVAAILCVAFPDKVPFMADEAVRAVPELSSTKLDYSLTQYIAYAKYLQRRAKELNDDSG